MAETHSNGVASPNNNAKPDLQSLKLGQGSFSNPGLSSATAASVDNFDEIIPHPEDVPHRNLVLCFDGTGDQFDSDVSPYLPIRFLSLIIIDTDTQNSNIVAFFSMLKRDDIEQQLVYYQVRQFQLPHGKYGPTIILIYRLASVPTPFRNLSSLGCQASVRLSI